MTQEEHDRKILIERAAVEELLLKEHISVPAAYERVRETLCFWNKRMEGCERH